MAPRIDILDDLVARGHTGFTSANAPGATGRFRSGDVEPARPMAPGWPRGSRRERSVGDTSARVAGNQRGSARHFARCVAIAFEGIPHRIAYRSALDYQGLRLRPHVRASSNGSAARSCAASPSPWRRSRSAPNAPQQARWSPAICAVCSTPLPDPTSAAARRCWPKHSLPGPPIRKR